MSVIENKTAPFIQSGNCYFGNEKTKNIVFDISFSKAPSVDLTLGDETLTPPYRISVTRNGFTIKFKINYTGEVEWKATDPQNL